MIHETVVTVLSIEGWTLIQLHTQAPILDLREQYLPQADFYHHNLQGANFGGADLTGAEFRCANLRRSNLKRACLRLANLMDADLSSADLEEADLREAILYGANLAGAKLNGALLKGAKYTRETLWPDRFDPGCHGARWVRAKTFCGS